MQELSRPHEVLVVTPHYTAHGFETEAITDTLIREIARREHIHFTWAATAESDLPEMMGQSLLPMNGTVLIEQATGKAWPLWSRRAYGRLQEVMERADQVWIHGDMAPCFYRVWRLAKKLRKPVVMTFQGGLRNKAGFLARLFDKRITMPLLRAVDHAFFTSDRVGEDYYNRAAFTKPISIVPNGVDLRVFHAPLLETRRYLRQQFALKAEQPILLFVGPFTKAKGLLMLRELAKRMPNWRFWLAGNGKIDPERWLLPNVHVFRDRRGPMLAELYHAADLLLAPGETAGFPRAIQEAMACGLPVMTSPEIAAGSRAATPFLHLAHVWARDPARTAEVWHRKLLDFPLHLPLSAPLYDIADFAQLTWEWAPIASVYAEVFHADR
jgi:glycosyltransferase involved in cell wall biosynthesis